MQASTLRPGLLVSLKTSIRGNCQYRYQDIEREHVTDDGQQRARWETERTVSDPTEYELARKIRNKIRSIITGTCAHTSFGLLCPEASSDRLDSAIVEARRIADEFNAEASLTRVSANIIAGRIAPDDVEAIKAINSEVTDLLAKMEDGVRNLDVRMVRDAADRARDVGRMLSPEAQERIKTVIDAARGTARQIVKAGEQAAIEVDQVTIRRIVEARTAFLDIDLDSEIATPAAEARAVEFEPASETESIPKVETAPTAPAAPELEWEDE
jgi:hypothetical protein